MKRKHAVGYYFILIAALLFLFFTNDFGLIDIQKTALVIAVGIDKDDGEFLLTSQIAVPQGAKQGEEVKAVEVETRGNTVADALDQINAKTGWYPKLVFCSLIVLGEDAAQDNAFDALDFFLRDDYASDDCHLAVCQGKASDVIKVKTPIENISALAAQKVLSDHSARVGTVAPATLKSFAQSSFSEGKSGLIPVLEKQPLKETDGAGENGSSGSAGASQEKSSGNKSGETQGKSEEENLYYASETALFYDGTMKGKLTKEQTFALCAVQKKLRLAAYSVQSAGANYTLMIKHNEPKVKFSVKNAQAKLEIDLTMTAGVEDAAVPQTPIELGTPSDVPKRLFDDAEKQLAAEILSVFDTAKACGCDVFDLTGKLKKYERNYFAAFKNDVLARTQISVKVRFKNMR